MTVVFESGYSLPGGDEPLKHARVVHAGNKFQVRTVSASPELAGSPGSAANNPLTYEFWEPYANALIGGSDLTDAAWTLDGITIGSDGQTVTEDTSNGLHRATQSFTWAAVENVAFVRVKLTPGGRVFLRILVLDGTTNFNIVADFRDLTTVDSNGVGDVISLGNDTYLVRMYFTPAAAGGSIEIALKDEVTGLFNYQGVVTAGMQWLEAGVHLSSATLRFDLFGTVAGDVFAIAAHNIGTGLGRVTFEHDSDENDAWTSIGSVSPVDNSPIMFIFVPITSVRWRITVDRGVLPRIGILQIATALQFERPFYGGFSPSRMARRTTVTGNMSEGGEFLGRSKIRSSISTNYSWSNLTYAWVRANLDGLTGLIQSIETEPFFLAWRSSSEEDVDFGWTTGPVSSPTLSGPRDLMTFGFQAEGYGYE